MLSLSLIQQIEELFNPAEIFWRAFIISLERAVISSARQKYYDGVCK